MIRILVVLLLVLNSIAYAHEDNSNIDKSLAEWYRSLTTVNGGSCCNMKDCFPTDAKIVDGHWQVPTEDLLGWEIVPDDAVLKHTNEQGLAVLCRYIGRIICFVPASEI